MPNNTYFLNHQNDFNNNLTLNSQQCLTQNQIFNNFEQIKNVEQQFTPNCYYFY